MNLTAISTVRVFPCVTTLTVNPQLLQADGKIRACSVNWKSRLDGGFLDDKNV